MAPRRRIAVCIDPVYNIRLAFVYGPASWQTIRLLQQFDSDGIVDRAYLADARGVTVHGGGAAVAIWVEATGDVVEDVAVVAHECQHAVLYVLGRAGMQPTDESSEAYTYYMEFLMRFCLSAFLDGKSVW